MDFAQTLEDTDTRHYERVLETYELAMYQAQCLERQLAMVLATHAREQRKLSIQEFGARLNKLFHETFGSVFREMRKSVNLPEQLEEHIKQAVDKRNWLTHNYFWERAGHLLTHRERESIIAELKRLAKTFDELDRTLEGAFVNWMRKNGISEQMVQRCLRELIMDADGTKQQH